MKHQAAKNQAGKKCYLCTTIIKAKVVKIVLETSS